MESEVIQRSVTDVISQIWKVTLDLSIHPEKIEAFRAVSEELCIGTVLVSGAWQGSVQVSMSLALAKICAARVFNGKTDVSESEQLSEVLKEFANIVGGNLKTALPEPCGLSTPTYVQSSGPFDASEVGGGVFRFCFASEGQPVVVEVRGGRDLDGRGV